MRQLRRTLARSSLTGAIFFAFGTVDAAVAQVAVTTWHNDLARTGLNSAETVLTPAAVSSGKFGLSCAYPVDGQIYAQPLVVPNVKVGGIARNLVFVATEHDSVYAFDATCATAQPVWHTSFLGTGITTMPCQSSSDPQCDPAILSPERGITGTPVIDRSNKTIYVAAQSVEQGVYTQKLHGLDLATGTERAGSPVLVQGNSGGTNPVPFDPVQAFQRAGLLLLNGEVFVAYASNDSARGWLFGFDGTTFALRHVFCTTPGGQLGGIWGGGAAPAADSNGYIYLATGNGTFDANVGGSDYGESVLKLQPQSNGTILVSDYFSPTNEATLSADDYDIASAGLLLLPTQSGTHPNELLVGDKIGRLFLLNRDRLGHLGTGHAVETLNGAKPYLFSTAAVWNKNVYLAGVDGVLKQWQLSGGLLPTSPAYTGSRVFNFPGSTPSVSANGTTGGIVWTLNSNGLATGGPPAALDALDATNVSTVLYTNNATTGGPGVKFAVPTVANGRVYVGTQTELDIYGLN